MDPRVHEYETQYGRRLLGKLGFGPGQDGFVMRSDRLTAVKFFDRSERFHRELEVYQILQSKGINHIAGHNVPELIDANSRLRTIEMTIVERPFILDFAGARRPEEVPEFEEHVLQEHLERLQKLFGERCIEAIHVAEMFRLQTGFVLLDLHPGNIAFVE